MEYLDLGNSYIKLHVIKLHRATCTHTHMHECIYNWRYLNKLHGSDQRESPYFDYALLSHNILGLGGSEVKNV